MPNMDRVATAALKGSSVERWLQQSGTAMTISAVILITLLFGVARRDRDVHVHAFVVGVPWSRSCWASASSRCCSSASGRRASTSSKSIFPKRSISCRARVRAGHAFSAGMKMVADELDDPVGPEFRKAFDEQNFGLPLKESLNDLARSHSAARRQVLRDRRAHSA